LPISGVRFAAGEGKGEERVRVERGIGEGKERGKGREERREGKGMRHWR